MKFRPCKTKYKAEIDKCIDENKEIDQRQFWYLLKKNNNPNRHSNILRDSYNAIISDNEGVIKLWEAHFKRLAQPSKSPHYDDNFKTFLENELNSFYSSPEEMSSGVFNKPITPTEVRNVCIRLKCGKAQDFTGLTYEHFKYAGENVYKVLARL